MRICIVSVSCMCMHMCDVMMNAAVNKTYSMSLGEEELEGIYLKRKFINNFPPQTIE